MRAFEELIKGSSRAGVGVMGEVSAAPGGPCPEPGEWALLLSVEARAAGSASVDALLAHAADCRTCAERLRKLCADASPEEEAEIGKLASASRDWRRNLASQLADTPHRTRYGPGRNKLPRLYLWGGAGLAASLLIAGLLSVWWRLANSPERLLAEAYTHSRIFDLRMPGAGFAAVTPETHFRGSASGREPAKLLEARARIEDHLEAAPEDPHWLQLEARADILEEKFDPAIDILDRLLAAGPATSSLLVDDAAAYFERGAANGSENDRATALEYLRHADELTPGDPVVLFNEAVAMEDRGQVMNAVETWNRYLRFERDPGWLAEGRRRLQALEQKLNQLKSHQSRMQQHLETPQAMRALAADPATLGAIDEELSSTLLPRLLESAFPKPVDRSRGSPCGDNCQAARTLLDALAASLERNHQDPWLTQLLPANSSPPDSFPPNPEFTQAAGALAQAIIADLLGDFPTARQRALEARQLFHTLHNPAGEDRAQVEESYALVRSSKLSGCYQAVHPVVGRNPGYQWIQIHALTQDTLCDPAPGTASENNPGYLRAISLAHARGYTLLELRARNLLGSAAVDSGDAEAAWRVDLPTVRKFYSGDYAPLRLYGTLSGMEQVEETTPRVRHTLLLQREVVAVLELTQARELIPTERFKLASVAIRAGSIEEAEEQMRLAQGELAANGGGASVKSLLAENEIALADAYLDRQDLSAAAKMLDAALKHMAGEQNSYHRRDYAAARGRLELAQGHPATAEPLLLNAIVEEERLAGKDGTAGIVLAQQDRDLYAVLAGVWLAEDRSGEEVLALWERYRLRILGVAVAACPDKGLACLQPELAAALKRLGPDRVLGQLVLPDRLLLYRASAGGVVWLKVAMRREEVQAAAEPLERAVSSPATPISAVDRAERRAGAVLLDPFHEVERLDGPAGQNSHLSIESDPLLGNLPWPSVATAAGPIGLQTNLEEWPSLLLDRRAAAAGPSATKPAGNSLIVGASVAAGESQFLPEALSEARAVARFGNNPDLLLGDQATEPQVTARLATATSIHFAGHAAQRDGATRLLLAPAKTAPGATSPAGAGRKEASPDTPWLDSDLLRRHPPRATRLAVFSACSTGKKEEGGNHGMGDIVDTLAALGVPEVVATRWQIDSASAVPMMDAFYGGLAKGLSVAQALTAARQSLVRDSRYRHPYYWAAWYASGTGNSDFRALFHAAR